VAQAEIFDIVLKLVGVVISTSGVGSAAGITIAVIGRSPQKKVQACGFKGTAAGFVLSLLLVLAVLLGTR
jgi:hypothetical protein